MSNAAEKVEQAPRPYAGELVELNRVEQAMAELKAKHGTVPDYGTKQGYEQGKASIRELTKYRTGTDKARLAITKPHRDFIDHVNQYAKGLIGEIEQLEGPHRDAKKEVDEAEARKKEERIARLRERLEREVTSYLDTARGLDSNGLADLIESAETVDTEGYFDITTEAEDEKARVVRELISMHAAVLERERIAAEQAEIEAQRRKLQEEEKRRADEQAELEELRRFKAEQEAAKAAAEAPTTTEQRTPIDTSRIARAADDYYSAIPTEDMAEVGDLIEEHQAALKPASQIEALTVTITLKEYDQLLADQAELSALHAAGVDNWSGYGEAMASLKAA